MPYFYLIIDLTVALSLIVLAIVVLIRDRRAELGRMFALFAISISIWIFANYISNDTALSTRTAVIANYFVFFFSYAATIALLRFSISLADDQRGRKIFSIIYPGLVVIGCMSATPLIVQGVSIQHLVYAVHFGPGIAVYGICLLSMMAATFFVIFKNLKRSTGSQRARLRLLFLALCWALPATLMMEFILPATTGWFGLTNIGILPMLILVFALYYGAVKHQMFDIRFFAVRAAAYVLTLAIVSILYIAPILYFTNMLVPGPEMTWPVFLMVIIIMSIAGALYNNVRTIFNRATSKLFFRDNYDPEKFIAELNQTVVSTLDLEALLTGASKVIAKNIKSEYCVIVLQATQTSARRIIGTEHKSFIEKDLETLHTQIPEIDARVIVPGLFEDNKKLTTLFRKYNIALIARLIRQPVSEEDAIGGMILGPKKNGTAYNVQDTRILETIVNGLIVAIQNALRFEEIQNFNITLQQRVEDRTRQLQRTNEKLKALDETKDDFISMASHQLRTPLTSVKGYLSMVLEGDAGNITPLQKKMLNQAFMSSQHMVFLIADLLNVSRLKTGKFVIEPAPINLANLIQEEIGQLHETAASRSLKLTYDKPKDFPTLMLDETKTRQVVMNFIDNAIHYTPAHGHISVELSTTPQSVQLRVRDDGIGVPKSEQPHLFTKFYRAVNARRERPDGTGLGLFMAKKVVLAQGGAVLFESKEGQGSMFGFTLPKQKLLTTLTK